MTLNKERLVDDLLRLGIQTGDCLGLGVSLRSVGWIDEGPAGLIWALLSVLEDQGTIFIPTYTKVFSLPLSSRPIASLGGKAPSEYVFDPATTPPTTGSVPKAILKMPGVVRSRHPTSSIGAIGKHATYLTKGHDETSPAYSPYSRLAELHGKLLCIGIDGRLVGLRHQAQYLAGLLTVLPPNAGVKYRRPDGSVGLFVRKDPGGCTKRLPELNASLADQAFIARGRIGAAECLLVDAYKALGSLTEFLRDDPTLNLCSDYTCLWCREVERRLRLYGRIAEPRIHQRSRVVARITGAINSRRLRNSRWGERAAKLMSGMLNRAERRSSSGEGVEEESE